MKSSAMRDLMALTERDDVISLAGGLPDTSTFPPDSYAALMGSVAARVVRTALQYGPTEGLELVKRLHRRGDGGRGHDGRPRRRARHDRRPAGDRPRLQDPARPGRRRHRRGTDLPGRRPDLLRLPGRRRPGRDGPRRDADRRARPGRSTRLERDGRRPKFIYTVPNFHNPAGRDAVARAPPRAGQDRRRAGAAVLEDNPYGLLRYEGDPLPTLLLARQRLRALRGHLLEDPLARRPARLAGRAGPGAREADHRQAGRPTCAPPRSPSTSSARTSSPARGPTTCAR